MARFQPSRSTNANGEVPGNLLATLINPERRQRGVRTFAAPPGTTLRGETDYFVVVSIDEAVPYDEAVRFGRVSSPIDCGAFNGWSIVDPRPVTNIYVDVPLVMDIEIAPAGHPDPRPTLISNFDEERKAVATQWGRTEAQAFTTGSHASGYSFRGIKLPCAAYDDTVGQTSEEAQDLHEYTGAFSAWLYDTDTSGKPAGMLYQFTPPDDFLDGDIEFTTPDDATLEPDTTYAVVLEFKGLGRLYTPSDFETRGGLAAGASPTTIS